MPSKSKAKGSGWENVVAKYLSSLYGESFTRVPNSGAYIGGKNAHRKEVLHEGQIRSFKGDIIPGQSFPRLNVECKFYADLPFHQLFQGEVKLLESWIEQLLDVEDEGDFSILIMKFNRKGKFVMFHMKHFKLRAERYLTYTSEKYGNWIFMDFDTFWDKNSEAVKELCK